MAVQLLEEWLPQGAGKMQQNYKRAQSTLSRSRHHLYWRPIVEYYPLQELFTDG